MFDGALAAPMSKPLVITISHSIGREEALRRLRGGVSRFAGGIPMINVEEESWNGDQMTFRVRAVGQVATGNVTVTDEHVRFEMLLPWLLQGFGETLQNAIKQQGQVLLGHKPEQS